jgi:aminoglycoside phosphotransferase (APT) family kinase protein
MSFAPEFPWLDLQIWLQARLPGHTDLQWIGRGYESTVYGLRYQGKEWVLRFQSRPEAFAHEAQLTPLLLAQGLPVPGLLASGEWKHGFYALSERCAGGPVWDVPAATLVEVVSPVLLRLHTWQPGAPSFPLPRTDCQSETWQAFLHVPLDWADTMSSTTRDLLQDTVPLYLQLLDDLHNCLPLPSHDLGLVHGDLSPANLCLNGLQLTGIFDWGNLAWGDFLLDWAKLLLPTLAPGDLAPLNRLHQIYQQAGLDTAYFRERFVCCAMRVMLVRLTLPIYGDPTYQLQKAWAVLAALLASENDWPSGAVFQPLH